MSNAVLDDVKKDVYNIPINLDDYDDDLTPETERPKKQKSEDKLILLLARTGTHSDLF